VRQRGKTGRKSPKAGRHKTLRSSAPKTERARNSSPTEQKREFARLTRELEEAREQQIATSEVLKVISSSSGELEPVFEVVLENATQICQARFGALHLYDGEVFRRVALHNPPPQFAMRRGEVIRPHPKGGLGTVERTKQVAYIDDVRTSQPYLEGNQHVVEFADLTGARTAIAVPMLKDDKLVGAIAIFRQEIRPFTDKQIQLVQNFAAQAVIAIENARLLNELRQRTDDLSEALEQQTASSEVLKVISSSPGELKPVFQAMLENATRICEAKFGMIFQFDGERFECTAEVGTPPDFAEFLRRQGPFQPLQGSHLDRIMRTKQISHTADYAADGVSSPPVKLGGARSTVDVPMLKDNELVGAFAIYRQEVRPFTDKQISLLTSFAAQAVIAIENARLLNDLNKLNQQLGKRVTDQVSEIERMGRLRRFLPPQVADLIVASGTEKQLESHRREITALFCDLRGFTGFSESSDPEDVMALLREYHAAIGEIITKYSGTLERYAGDGVMVVFNDPIPVDNPALQAVRMAIDMRAAIGGLIEKWRKLGHDIGFGIGIAHGFATLGTIGFEGRFDYAAIGTVSNVASRLCDEAKPGQILISPRVLMAVEKDITVEPLGDFSLKGIRRPLTAYNVVSE
jgi:class 3 adenylate cyclase/putative methionine-R-sulfoxide reductase with GAF domain